MATEIRKISYSDFRKHLGTEMKFVHEEMGHLWLFQHGHPRGVVIPMRDEAVLHRAVGLNPAESFHRAMVACDRRVAAINERSRWVSTEVMTQPGHMWPALGMTDESYAQWRAMDRSRG